jgi:hypothetical protein
MITNTNTITPVVKNDTLNGAESDIAGVVHEVTQQFADQFTQGLMTLETLALARESWETTELAASNERLYALLTQAYSFYQTMKNDPSKEVRECTRKALDKFIQVRGYVFTNSSHDMTRVVKCVFGMDRRRVSAYSISLRAALAQKVGVSDLATFLRDSGGVEQVRLGGKKAATVTQRAKLGQALLGQRVLGELRLDAGSTGADTDWNDSQVVLIATYRPSGAFEINAVVKNDTAVNVALAGYHSVNKNQQEAGAADPAQSAAQDAMEEAKASALASLQQRLAA